MSERSVRVAISIHDHIARNTACSMFSSAGARVQACDDAALGATVDEVQAIVLGLNASPDKTLDALAMLRKRSATIPIYVVADAAGERHAKRAKKFGATEVIPHEMLKRRVGHLVQQVAQANKIDDWGIRSPGWAPTPGKDGYDLESMDLGAWLQTPENRRLLGVPDPSPEDDEPAETPPGANRRPGADRAERTAPPSGAVARDEMGKQPSPQPGADTAPEGDEDGLPCGLADCPRLSLCREEHDAQNAAILGAHKQREKRLQTDIKNDMHQLIAQQIAASEAKMQVRIDQAAAEVRLEMASAIRRIQIMIGVLGGILALGAITLVWRLAA